MRVVRAALSRLGTTIHLNFWDRLLDRYLGQARATAGADADAAWARGLALPFDDAVALALQEGIANPET